MSSRESSEPRRNLQNPGTPSATSLLLPKERDSISSASTASTPSARFFPSPRRVPSLAPSVSEKYSLSPDPNAWGALLNPNIPEPDDFLHNPDPKRKGQKGDSTGSVFTLRGLQNLGCVLFLVLCVVTLFAGYPVISFLTRHPLSTLGGFNLGGINATGQIPSMAGNWGLIDADTPDDAMTIRAFKTGEEMELVFSDEFQKDGRSFYPGDDPYWEAVDLHYWATNNYEWYDPAAVTTKDGYLEITLSKKDTHEREYEGGMLATWNKFCFTEGLVLASVILPGSPEVSGLWPAVWAMGNLGRAGYGASLEGTWPYSYDACDVGTAPNQTIGGLPEAATINGDPYNKHKLSYQSGQRLSRCTCPGEAHPGPVHSDGTYVGRAAPEIDVFEAQVGGGKGAVSQSAQWAPFNEGYNWFNTSDFQLLGPDAKHNTYKGGVFQQTTSAVAHTNQQCYELSDNPCSAIYGFEYKSGYDDAYITWINDNKIAWTVMAGGLGPDPKVEIAARPIPFEPMYLLINLGMSKNFGFVDFENLVFPTKMRVDWIRVYQKKGKKNVGCDPIDFPTSAYIERYAEAYTNPNLTTWVDDYGQTIPRNRLMQPNQQC